LGQVDWQSIALHRKGTARRLRRAALIVAPILAIVVASGLSGCGSISQKFAELGSQAPGVGLSASAPQRPAEAAPYPAVHDIPPPRNSVTLTSTEKVQMESDLVGARNEQQQTVAKPEKKKDQKAQPQGRVIPASSRASIY
jgi:hypothetical protein